MKTGRETGVQKWLLRLVKVVIFVVVMWSVSGAVRSALAELNQYPLRIDAGWLVAAGGLYLVGLLPSGLFWYAILHALGQRPALFDVLRAYYIGSLGKYVPGKAMVVVLRVGLVRSSQVDTSVAAVSVLLETLTMMAVGACMAALVLLFAFQGQTGILLVAMALMVLAGLPTWPPLFRRLVRLLPSSKSHLSAGVDLDRINFRLMALGWAGVSAGWCLLGLSLWATLRALGIELTDPVTQLPTVIASVALAVVAGFLSLIPGGLGVRDAVLSIILVPEFGELVAVVSAILLRLVWLLSELGISCILYFARRRSANRQ